MKCIIKFQKNSRITKRTVSIKRTVLKFFKKSLLNVPYDRKTEGLKALTYRTYNREHRVQSKECILRGHPSAEH